MSGCIIMKPHRKKSHVTVLLTLLACCQLVEASGFCRFAEMFSSKEKESCDGPTKTSEDEQKMTSTELPTSEQQTTRQLIPTPPTTPPTTPPCAPSMVLGPTCDCDRTCQDPTSCNCTGPETCVCPDGFLLNSTDCVPEQQCGCFDDESGFVIADGYEYFNHECSEKCSCSNDQLTCNPGFSCSPYASCRVEDDVRRCYCDDGYVGDGETCTLYMDCYDAYQAGHREDGVFTILPYGWPGSSFNVSCDMTTNGGGWTIIQRYIKDPLVTHSSHNWETYKIGFGSPSGRHWLGNEKIFYLTTQRNYTLRFDFITDGGSAIYQEYSLFRIANESDNYRLIELGNNNGNAGNGMDGSLGQQFSTLERDNDECDLISCSSQHGLVGWWFPNKWCDECCSDNEDPACFYYGSCYRRCTKANVNGDPSYEGILFKIFWNDLYDIISTEMKIRPVE